MPAPVRTIAKIDFTDDILKRPGAHSDRSTVLQSARDKLEFELTAYGVNISYEGDVFSFVPWSRVRQVHYATVPK